MASPHSWALLPNFEPLLMNQLALSHLQKKQMHRCYKPTIFYISPIWLDLQLDTLFSGFESAEGRKGNKFHSKNMPDRKLIWLGSLDAICDKTIAWSLLCNEQSTLKTTLFFFIHNQEKCLGFGFCWLLRSAVYKGSCELHSWNKISDQNVCICILNWV